MLTIIHGEDIIASRNFFLSEKKKASDSPFFNGEVVKLTDLVQELEGGSLFGSNKTIFIENLLNKRKPSKELDEILEFLNKNQDSKILIWEGKELTKKVLSVFKKSEIKVFSIPKTLFSFLDSIKPQNPNLINSFHSALKTSETELLFFMLIRQIRLLLALSDSGSKNIDEVARLAPWQKSKLQQQAKLFSLAQLKKLYRQLYDLDLGVKTGANTLPLTQNIDFLLLDL